MYPYPEYPEPVITPLKCSGLYAVYHPSQAVLRARGVAQADYVLCGPTAGRLPPATITIDNRQN